MIKFPGRDFGGVFSFIQGFTPEAWLGCFGLLLTFPAVLYLTYLILLYFHLKEPVAWNFELGLFLFMGAVSQQGSENSPKFLSTRTIFFMIFLISVYVLQAFSASYTSFLSVAKQLKPFNTIEDLYTNTDFRIGSTLGTADFELFSVKNLKKIDFLKTIFFRTLAHHTVMN